MWNMKSATQSGRIAAAIKDFSRDDNRNPDISAYIARIPQLRPYSAQKSSFASQEFLIVCCYSGVIHSFSHKTTT
jgi:hypothetical protein